MFIRRVLFTYCPQPSRMDGASGSGIIAVIARTFVRRYTMWWLESQMRVIAWHRAELQRLDVHFQYAEATRQLIQARERARQAGIGPLDRNYPDLDDFV